MWPVLALLPTLALLGASPEPPAAPARKIAVLPFEVAKGLDEELGKTLAGALMGEVRKARGATVNVMAPDDVVQALPEALRNRLKRCAMAACKAQMAQAVGADRALGGNLSKIGSTVVLNLALLEASDGTQVGQWTGKAPENSVDKLLEQLPLAVAELFPVPKPAVVIAPSAPVPAPVVASNAQPAPVVTPNTPPAANPAQPGVVAPVPTSQPVVAPLLPGDDLPPGVPEISPSLAGTPPAPAQTAPANAPPPAAQPAEEPGWSQGFLNGALGLAIPGIGIGAALVVAAAAGVGLSVASYVAAQNINTELKSVPHKESGDSGFPLYPYDLSALIFTGKLAQGTAVVGVVVAAICLVVGVIAVGVGAGGGGGLLYAAAPKKEDPAKGAQRPAQPATTGAQP